MTLILGEQEYCYKLAHYLTKELNEAYGRERQKNPSLPNVYIVRSFRSYDDLGVPLSEFPLLKVYRNTDSFKPGTLFRGPCQGTITYSVSYPNLKELPDLMYWVSWQINKGLLKFFEDPLHQTPNKNLQNNFSSQYLISANEVTNAVYPFLRFTFNFFDYYSPDKIS